MSSRPNLVLIMVDQLGARTLQTWGGSVPSTPSLDALAREGVRFDRCYATVPLCGPNRACLLTGRSPEVHGMTHNAASLDSASTPTYAQVLRANGYRTGGFGKFHQQSMALPVPEQGGYLGFDEIGITEDPRLGPWLDWIEGEHPEHFRAALATCWRMPYLSNYGPQRRDLLETWFSAYKEILVPLMDRSRWRLMYPSPLPAELQQTTWITDRAIDFINRSSGDRPFLCKVSYVDPHDPYDPPEPYASMFNPADMPRPIARCWDPQKFGELQRSLDFHGWDAICEDPQAIAELRAMYHGSLRFLDDQIARIIRTLRERGLWENTIVVFTSDHGEMLGDHALNSKGVKHYDAGIRCPLLVAGGLVARGRTSDRLLCTLDFMPTLLDFAGVPSARRPPLEGRSFAGACVDGIDLPPAWPEISVTMTYETGHGGGVRSVITDDAWRLTYFCNDACGQMFDLRNDPDEVNDLYDRPEHTPKKVELLERLTRASIAPLATPQHRGQPVIDGVRYRTSGFELSRDGAFNG